MGKKFFRRKLTEAEIQAKETKKLKLKSFVEKVSKMTEEEITILKEKIAIVTCEGHALSERNCLLLDMQGEDVEINVSMVGGYDQWNKVGRYVKKGEKNKLSILVPSQVNEKDTSGNVVVMENGDNKKRTYFKWVPVYDISQTTEKEPEDSILEPELITEEISAV